MKIAAVVLVLIGIANLVGAVPAFFGATPLIDAILAFLIGCFALLVAFGILKKRRFAWRLGFALIGAGTLYFLASVMPFALQKEGTERVVLLSSCVIGSLLVAAFWSVVWHCRRGYFFPDEKTA